MHGPYVDYVKLHGLTHILHSSAGSSSSVGQNFVQCVTCVVRDGRKTCLNRLEQDDLETINNDHHFRPQIREYALNCALGDRVVDELHHLFPDIRKVLNNLSFRKHLVFGHVHTPGRGRLGDGEYLVLPAFDEDPVYLTHERGGGLRFRGLGEAGDRTYGPLEFAAPR